jgi:hypothetical protein
MKQSEINVYVIMQLQSCSFDPGVKTAFSQRTGADADLGFVNGRRADMHTLP